MKRIAVFNQKGGCAKTTTVVNLAGILSKRGYKILVVDCDPQANASSTLLMENDENDVPTIVDVLSGHININEAVQVAYLRTRGNGKPKDVGISVIPAERGLSAVDLASESVLADAIHDLIGEYDYILFDCPPYISVFTINILAASDYVLVPATVDKDSLDGYGELVKTIYTLKCNGVDLKILGVFLTLLNQRESFDQYICRQCAKIFGDEYIPVSIRRHTFAKQASLFGRPLCYYRPSSPVSKDYDALVDNILERIK